MKIEMHTHTAESSPCAKVSAAQMISLYQNAGYDGVVITDHYSKWVMDVSSVTDPKDYIDYFLTGYHSAVAAAKDTGFTVFPGAEVTLSESPNDYLLYGVTEEFFYRYPLLFQYSLQELQNICHQNDILLFQAHPNRSYCSPSPAKLLDGAEIYNGNPRHNNQNEKTKPWVEENHLLFSSGSDFHEVEDLAKGGIETPFPVRNWSELKDVLLHGDFKLLLPK